MRSTAPGGRAGRPAARAVGATRGHGGAAANRRRRPRKRVGKRSRSRSRPRGSSPGGDLGRRMAGGRSSAERAELGVELQWWTASAGSIRPWSDSNRARGGSWIFGVRLGSSGVKGSRRDGEERPTRRALLARLGSSCTRARTKRKGDWQGSFQGVREEKSGAGARLPTRGVARRWPQRR